VVTIYVQRDTPPEKWYPLNADGTLNMFGDLPAQHHASVNAAEVDDVVALLRTRSDGYER